MELVTMFKNLPAALVAMSLVAVSQPASAQISLKLYNGAAVPITAINGNIVKIYGSNFNIYADINTAETPQTADTATRGIWLNNILVSSSALKPGMSCVVVGWKRHVSSMATPASRLPLDGEAPPSVDTTGYIHKMVCKG